MAHSRGPRLAIVATIALALAGCHSPTATPIPRPTVTPGSLHPTAAPANRVALSVVTADGALWYTCDDARGGIAWGQETTGLYRLQGGTTRHFDLALDPHVDHIRVLRAAPDGSLYVGLGWGLLRHRDGQWETLVPLAEPHRFNWCVLDVACTGDEVWAGGQFGLARFDGQAWQEYPVATIRLAVAPDGSVWARGWDGAAGSNCCVTHVMRDRWASYPLSDTASIPEAVRAGLVELGGPVPGKPCVAGTGP